MINEHKWTSHFSNYVELYDIEMINAPITDGISLYEIIDKFQFKTYPRTNAKDPYKAYLQQSYREISIEAKNYINQLLEAKFIQFGKDETLFLDSKSQTS